MGSRVGAFLREKDSFAAQVVKYLVSGGISVVVVQVTFYLLAWLVLPCMRATDPVARLLVTLGFTVEAASEAELKRNFWIIMVICFLLSNAVAYLLNMLFVFNTGRHRKVIEILLFFGASLLQFLFIWIGGILISVFKWEVTYSNLAMLAAGLIVNYLVRKYIVFRG
ncbi:GtrA family protein [Pontiellaceae bacterium B1224]|nr:GtrA family protein [Pontiellaceae bacterium B1224]